MPRISRGSLQIRQLTSHTPIPHQQTGEAVPKDVEPEVKPYSAIPGPKPLLGKWGNVLEMGKNISRMTNYLSETLNKHGDIARIRLPGSK